MGSRKLLLLGKLASHIKAYTVLNVILDSYGRSLPQLHVWRVSVRPDAIYRREPDQYALHGPPSIHSRNRQVSIRESRVAIPASSILSVDEQLSQLIGEAANVVDVFTRCCHHFMFYKMEKYLS